MTDMLEMKASSAVTDTLDAVDGKVKDIQKAEKAFKAFNKSIGAFGKEKIVYSNITKILNSDLMKGMSSIMAGASMVFTVINLFTDQESDTDKILNAIAGIDKKLNNLQNLMIARFDGLEAHIDDTVRTSNVVKDCSIIDAYYAHINSFLNAKNQTERDYAVEALKKIDIINSLDVAVSHIQDEVQTDLYENNKGLIELRAESTHGDLTAVSELVIALISRIQKAVFIRNTVSCLLLLDKENIKQIEVTDPVNIRDEIKNKIPSTLMEKMDEICALNSKQFNKVWSEINKRGKDTIDNCYKNQSENISKYLTEYVYPVVKSEDSQGISDFILKKLSERYSWLGYVVIVYDPVEGQEKHAIFDGTKNKSKWIRSWRQELGNNNIKKNCAISLYDPDKDNQDVSEISSEVQYFKCRSVGRAIPGGGVMTIIMCDISANDPAEKVEWGSSFVSTEVHNKLDLNIIAQQITEKNKPMPKIWIGQNKQEIGLSVSKEHDISYQWKTDGDKKHFTIGIFS